ncbi:MBL fold metallo-hydrolase [Methanogenium organophilum]|uniref:MBL fold metallo-hydrolase n=1 Tax=Methanogenium organophilum TaxID=2199 RepID=A0A9X9S1N8_METOG|nr:MBL fold metallo-hydrolase [Methanogenium organophilum]WAI00121.1 MBL fold metallo-hydrolase [Methanogenium organophilum]
MAMECTILADNTALTDRYLLSESGFSAYIRDGDVRVLFDTGFSGVFMDNARRMGIEPADTTHVVFSHGHLDHTWGLQSLLPELGNETTEDEGHGRPVFLSHPDVYLPRRRPGNSEIGTLYSAEILARFGTVQLSKEPVWITDRLVFLGEVPRVHDWEAFAPNADVTLPDGTTAPDHLTDDTALAYNSDEGLVIISGCSHSGIVNIIDHARTVCGEARIRSVIGGLHLMYADQERIDKTARALEAMNLTSLHACHCTGFTALHTFSRTLPLKETGTGLKTVW